MATWVYVRCPHEGLWTVGFYDPAGKWHTDSDHNKRENAAKRVHYLNGGSNDRQTDDKESEREP